MDFKKSILIIDDDTETLKLFTEVFLTQGFNKAMGMISGEDIKTIIKEKNPSVILLDVNITGENSLVILKEIKEASPLLPVIMIANQKEKKLAERALEFGACSYIIKSSAISDIVKDVKGRLDNYFGSEEKGKLSILVVDDDKEIAEMARLFLAAGGYNCVVANDARKALSMIRAKSPDLVFSDIVMPEMDGIELLEQIKRISKKIKVVMMSSVTDKEVCQEAIEKGASGYITKPFSVQQLGVTAMTTLLERQSQES